MVLAFQSLVYWERDYVGGVQMSKRLILMGGGGKKIYATFYDSWNGIAFPTHGW